MDQLKLLELIVLSNAVADSLIVGRKAANLAALKEKFSIPEWFVISPQAFFNSLSSLQLEALNKGDSVRNFVLNKAILESIQSALKKIMLEDSECFAVRSSAVDEDSEQASFAGQLESFLNVAPNQIPEKIYAVWNSAFSEHIMHYRKTFTNNQHGIPAVIVQRMVKAEIAGVAFSADPLTGHSDICVINATLGLGEKLMSGEVSGDTYFLNKNGILKKQNLIGQSAILNSENISKIIKLLLEVEKHFGVAQDIEWAIEKDVLYLLQARPITTLKNQTIAGSKRIVWDNSNIVESYSGVTAPLTFSFARYIYEHVYIEFCKLMGVSKSKIDSESNSFRNMLGYVNGHIYYHLLNWYRVLALFPGFKINRKYMEEMMGVKEALPEELISEIIQKKPTMFEKIIDIFSLTRTLGGLICQQIIFKKTIRSFYERLNKALKTSENLQKLSLEQLATEYRLLEKKLLKAWDAPLVNDFLCMIAFGLSRKLLEKYVGNEGLNFHNEIMIGQGDIISAEPAMRIRKMADLIMNDEAMIQNLMKGDVSAIHKNSELKIQYEDYLKKFGDRCLQELKLESLTLHDDPILLLQAIAHMARRPKNATEINNSKSLKISGFKLLENSPVKRWILFRIIFWAKARVRDRENLRFERTRLFGRVRNLFLEMGKRLNALKQIENVRDIFFLEVEEVIGFIEGSATIYDFPGLIKIRKKQNEEFNNQAPPPNRFETYGPAGYGFKTQSYQAEIASSNLNNENAENSIKGMGCCQGIVKAMVRVIHNPKEAELKPNEIMVARFTDPGWITLFANASGILVERGSLLSHSAIVAREMGIPAIVGISGVMEWLKTGDWVEMNGSTGIVKKIKEEIKGFEKNDSN